MSSMSTINTNQFGEMDVNDENVITFVQSIIGFDEFRKYVLVEDQKFYPIQWVQSTENLDLAFPIINPNLLNIEYKIDPAPILLETLKLKNINDAVIYTLLVIPSGNIEEVRTNLKAPIVINPIERLATQVVYENSKYPVQYYLFREKNANQLKLNETTEKISYKQ